MPTLFEAAARGPETARAARSRASELRLRVLSSLVLVAVAFGATWLGGVPFAILWVAAAIAILVEWLAMTRVVRPGLVASIFGAGLAVWAGARALGFAPAGLVAVLVTAAILALLCVRGLRDAAWATAGFGYAGAVAVVPILVRDEPGLGAPAILWMFAVVWTTDIAAFFAGRAIGGPRLWPAVSPGKTWSGFAGGLLAATACGALLAVSAQRAGTGLGFGLSALLAASALASVVSQGGDLAESALKRRFAVKDSGWLIPGHGGVMDRLDGFVAVAILVGLALAGARLAGPPVPP